MNFYVWCQVRAQLHSFACGYPVFSAPFVEKTVSLLHGVDNLIESHLTIFARIYFW